jgi:hypothetical protein
MSKLLVSLNEFSQLIEVPERTLRNWVHKGRLSKPDPITRRQPVDRWARELRSYYVSLYESEETAMAESELVGTLDSIITESRIKFADPRELWNRLGKLWKP